MQACTQQCTLVTTCASLHTTAWTAGGPTTLSRLLDLSEAPGGNLYWYVVHTTPSGQTPMLHNAQHLHCPCMWGQYTYATSRAPDHWLVASYCTSLPQTRSATNLGVYGPAQSPPLYTPNYTSSKPLCYISPFHYPRHLPPILVKHLYLNKFDILYNDKQNSNKHPEQLRNPEES